jgi:hypothetical protein
MLAITKSQRLFGSTLAVHIEDVGVRKDFFVAIPGLSRCDDAFASFDVLLLTELASTPPVK